MSIPDGEYKAFCAGENSDKQWLTASPDERVHLRADIASHWQVKNTPMGATLNVGGRFLYGVPKDGKVKLSGENDGSGVYWEVTIKGQYYLIRCMDPSGKKRYLDGQTEEGRVYLHSDTSRSGSRWLLLPT